MILSNYIKIERSKDVMRLNAKTYSMHIKQFSLFLTDQAKLHNSANKSLIAKRVKSSSVTLEKNHVSLPEFVHAPTEKMKLNPEIFCTY